MHRLNQMQLEERSEMVFYLAAGGAVTCILMLLILCVSSCTKNRDRLIVEAAKRGVLCRDDGENLLCEPGRARFMWRK